MTDTWFKNELKTKKTLGKEVQAETHSSFIFLAEKPESLLVLHIMIERRNPETHAQI